MNVAIVIAAGHGSRMGQDIPKQFLNVNNKPVIAYTLENFQNNELIDGILVVCLEGWENFVWCYAKQLNITKLKWVVKGGTTGQESIYNGISALKNELKKGDIAVIHDGIRPLVDDSVLTDVIEVAKKYGNGVTSLPYNEQIFVINEDNPGTTNKYIPRQTLRRVSTPQAYEYSKLISIYDKAFKEQIGIFGPSYTNTLYADFNETLYFAKGSDKNIKLTTKDDFEMFASYLKKGNEGYLK